MTRPRVGDFQVAIRADIEETPSFGTKLKTEFILGMAKTAGGIKILLDIDLVITSEDVEAVVN